MRSFRHWTPRYIVSRLRYMAFQRAHPDAPWLTQAAVSYLSRHLKPTDRGIEWGSGRSTGWIGKRVAYLHSVEDNPDFFEHLRPSLPSNVHYVLRDSGPRVPHPNGTAQSDGTAYVLEGETEPDESLDFALVDGESRCYCLRLAMRKLKPGGLLILDNADWFLPKLLPSEHPRALDWARNWRELESWHRIWTHNGVHATAFWIRPQSKIAHHLLTRNS